MGRPKLDFDHAEKVLNILMLIFYFILGNDAGVCFSFNKIMFFFDLSSNMNYFGFHFFLATLFSYLRFRGNVSLF